MKPRILAAIGALVVLGAVVVIVVTRDGDDRPASTQAAESSRDVGAGSVRKADSRSGNDPSVAGAAPGTTGMTNAPTLPAGSNAPAPSGPPVPRADLAFEAVGRGRAPKLEPELADIAAAAKRDREAGNHAAARAAADKVLAKHPEHPSMLRLAAEAACATGDAKGAQAYYDRASTGMRTAIAMSCHAHDIKLSDPPPKKIVPTAPTKR